jgi:hypothetical protein
MDAQMEPTTTAASGYAISKGATALAGLFGSISMSFLWMPAKFREHSRLAAGAIIGGIGVMAAIALGGLLIRQFGLDPESLDVALGVGYLVGAMSLGVIGWIANFFEKREKQDILQVYQEVKAKEAPKKPTRRVRAGVKK